jgi:hypothetical protein
MQLTSESKEFLSSLFSSIWKYALVVIVTLLVVYNCSGCDHKEKQKTVSDKFYSAKLDSFNLVCKAKDDSIAFHKKRYTKLDSIVKIKKADYVKAKKDNRIFIENNPCDSVGILSAYDNTVSKCDTVIIKDSIANQELLLLNKECVSLLNDKISMLQIKDKQTENIVIDLVIAQKEVKVQKRKKIVAILIGVLSVITTALIFKK